MRAETPSQREALRNRTNHGVRVEKVSLFRGGGGDAQGQRRTAARSPKPLTLSERERATAAAIDEKHFVMIDASAVASQQGERRGAAGGVAATRQERSVSAPIQLAPSSSMQHLSAGGPFSPPPPPPPPVSHDATPLAQKRRGLPLPRSGGGGGVTSSPSSEKRPDAVGLGEHGARALQFASPDLSVHEVSCGDLRPSSNAARVPVGSGGGGGDGARELRIAPSASPPTSFEQRRSTLPAADAGGFATESYERQAAQRGGMKGIFPSAAPALSPHHHQHRRHAPCAAVTAPADESLVLDIEEASPVQPGQHHRAADGGGGGAPGADASAHALSDEFAFEYIEQLERRQQELAEREDKHLAALDAHQAEREEQDRALAEFASRVDILERQLRSAQSARRDAELLAEKHQRDEAEAAGRVAALERTLGDARGDAQRLAQIVESQRVELELQQRQSGELRRSVAALKKSVAHAHALMDRLGLGAAAAAAFASGSEAPRELVGAAVIRRAAAIEPIEPAKEVGSGSSGSSGAPSCPRRDSTAHVQVVSRIALPMTRPPARNATACHLHRDQQQQDEGRERARAGLPLHEAEEMGQQEPQMYHFHIHDPERL